MFSLGGMLSKFHFVKGFYYRLDRRNMELCRSSAKFIKIASTIAIIAGAPVFIYFSIKMYTVGGGSNVFFDARMAAVEMGDQTTRTNVFWQFYPALVPILLFVYYAESNRIQIGAGKLRLLILLVALASAMLTTGRTAIYALALGLFYLTHKQRNAFRIALIITILTFILFSTSLVLIRGVSFDASGVYALLEHYLQYFLGPTAAFERVVNDGIFTSTNYAYNHSMQSWYRLSNLILGTNYGLAMVVDDYTSVPFYTNVYTVFKFFYLDFGIYGLYATMFVFGYMQSKVFRLAEQGIRLYKVMYAILMYPLGMCFFDDHYYNYVGYIKIYLLLFAYYKLDAGFAKDGARQGGH